MRKITTVYKDLLEKGEYRKIFKRLSDLGEKTKTLGTFTFENIDESDSEKKLEFYETYYKDAYINLNRAYEVAVKEGRKVFSKEGKELYVSERETYKTIDLVSVVGYIITTVIIAK